MLISMQGNWTVSVKSKNAAYQQQFVINGSYSSDGTYPGYVGSDPVEVEGSQWTIAIMNNSGSGFQLSDTQITFPQMINGHFVFDIKSNDAHADTDFDDLVLTCSTPAYLDQFLIYGNVKKYSDSCFFNPCWRNSIVIETYPALIKALENPYLKAAIEELYPERIPSKIVDPNPPDPPYFKPIMINLYNQAQLPSKMANVYRYKGEGYQVKADLWMEDTKANRLENFSLERTITAPQQTTLAYKYNRLELAKMVDISRFLCYTSPAKNTTLAFEEYDRTAAELAGGAYAGDGYRQLLGNAITDMNGNYIFRFTQGSFSRWIEENFDTAPGENETLQALPDIIAKIKGSSPAYATLYESGLHSNIYNLKRIDLCLPDSVITDAESLCENGNLIGSLGNIFIGGNQNTHFHAHTRTGYGNTLDYTGIVTTTNPSGPIVKCACWVGRVDLIGCMLNRSVKYYTIRYKKPTETSWNFVTEAYRHPLFAKRNLPGYIGELIGPFDRSLNVDTDGNGAGNGHITVKAYNNIQAEWMYDGVGWEWSNLDRYMQLTTSIYEAGEPGTVWFLVEGYDALGNKVPAAHDLVAMYINNSAVDMQLNDVFFAGHTYEDCYLYKLTDTDLNAPIPLTVRFKADELYGFMDNYQLGVSDCGIGLSFNYSPANGNAGSYNAAAASCDMYRGTSNVWGTGGLHDLTITPGAGGWLPAPRNFNTLHFGLSCTKRQTDGYSGHQYIYGGSGFLSMQRI